MQASSTEGVRMRVHDACCPIEWMLDKARLAWRPQISTSPQKKDHKEL